MTSDFKIGHYTDIENITGCSVILCPADTVASCYLSGSSPGSREIALLAPEKKINTINALLLTGGSAFGLNAAAGVMKYLEEKNIGYQTGCGVIPLVPAAVIYDLYIGDAKVRPVAENAYNACQEASENFDQQGSVGAGTGATVGKWAGIDTSMKGGLGIATLNFGKIFVRVVSVVNAVGDVVDEKGQIVAGALDKKGNFLAQEGYSQRWNLPKVGFAENTVLCAILTNAKLTKLEAYILSKRAQSGLARAIIPAATSYDGDVIFTLASGRAKGETEVLYEVATEAVRQSILSAIRQAESLGDYPALQDLTIKSD